MDAPPRFEQKFDSKVCKLNKSIYGLKNEQVERGFFAEFEIKDLGSLRYLLGMEIAHSKKGIVLSQRKYILDLLKEIGKIICKPTNTPIDPNQKFGNRKEGTPMDTSTYQRVMAQGVCEMLWQKKILEELRTPISLPLKLYCDNKVTINIAQIQHSMTIKEKVDK
ncbi:putative mitochondrial protein, partial [Mucuna pruriens]